MGFLLWMDRKFADKLKEGDIFLAYCIGYSTGRVFLEFLRLDAPLLRTINFNQSFMLGVALVSGFIIFWRHRKGTPKDTESPTPEA